MLKEIFIIHFLPLEGYPPILNLLDFFSFEKKNTKVTCLTTKGKFNTTYVNKKSKIKRFGSTSNNKVSLWLSYLIFNTFSVILLLIKQPKNVMYYETISSFPAFFYKKYINKKANLFIHYHEYTTKQEYLGGSPINRFFHQLEQQVYKDAKWISHTNEVRLHKFLTDNALTYNKDKHKLNPNYPSKKWGIKNKKWDGQTPVKLVFIGYSVNPSDCFILELIEWLSTQQQKTLLDIYCIKQNSLPNHLIGKQGNTIVNLLEPITYKNVPEVLKDYHIGLIIYKALTPNVIHCAPNKLFEYLACELDVWFPKEMEGCYPYISIDSNSKVLKIDFNDLNKLTIEELIEREHLTKNESKFYYENVYNSIYNELN